MQAYVACLIFAGDRSDNHLSTDALFDSEFGLTFYNTLFTKRRFEVISRAIRFDDQELRHLNADDKFRCIRGLWEAVIGNCQINYIPGPVVTVDEQLQATKTRCKFRMYLPDKPAKYGLKVLMVCDSASHYCLNAFPYLGQDGHPDKPAGILYGNYFTMKLLEPLQHIDNRIICTDNWFTSLGLVQALDDKNCGLVGTIKPKPTFPLEAVKCLNIPIGESVALYNHVYGVNVVYTRKEADKWVILISTEHHGFSYVEDKKTEMHMFYNSKKGGVDSFDQLCAASNTARKSNRWPMCSWHGLINIIINNAFICYNSDFQGKHQGKDRHKFNKDLAHALAHPYAEWRYYVRGPALQGQDYIRIALQQIFNLRRQQQQDAAAVVPLQVPGVHVPVVVDQPVIEPVAVFQRPNVETHRQEVHTPATYDPAYPHFPGNMMKTEKKTEMHV